MSDYAYERAVTLRLVTQLNEEEKEEFKREVQKQLGLQPGQDCDRICGSLNDQQFEDLIEWVKKTLRDRKRHIIEPMYA